MTNLIATAAFMLFLAGTATAQQKPAKRTAPNSQLGKTSTNTIMRSNPSAENTHDGTAGASAGVGAGEISAGTGLTTDQNQSINAGSTKRTTQVDARSSVRTSASGVKPKKKAPKKDNQ